MFIADDRRILINSHFTHNRFKSPIGAPHYRQMAGLLAAWMARTAPHSGTGNGLQAF